MGKQEEVKRYKRPSVYLAKNLIGDVIYVGRSEDVYNRMMSHWTNEEWWRDNVKSISVGFCKTMADMTIYEMYYINRYRPLYNRDGVYDDGITLKLPELSFIDMPIYKGLYDESAREAFTKHYRQLSKYKTMRNNNDEYIFLWNKIAKDYEYEIDMRAFSQYLGKFISHEIIMDISHNLLSPSELMTIDRYRAAIRFIEYCRHERFRYGPMLEGLVSAYGNEDALIYDLSRKIDWTIPRAYKKHFLCDSSRGPSNMSFKEGEYGLYYQFNDTRRFNLSK